jgi:lipopolysaccharide export system protein LptC
MKRFVQFFLILVLIILCIFFYKRYLNQETKIIDYKKKQIILNNNLEKKSQNNIINNLSYDANLDENRKYKITSDTSEIFYQDGVEIINMKSVLAKFFQKDKFPLTVKSDEAIYNSSNYNSRFKKNVKITYFDHIIEAENAYIDFNSNIILINENVRYKGPIATMLTDNIKINLATDSISVFMDDKIKDIKLELIR